MTMSEGGLVSKFVMTVVGDKRRWWSYKRRVRALPTNHRMAVDAIERYLMHFGLLDGEGTASLFEDVVELFEQAAADGTPIREIVGDDPVEFVEALARNYDKGGYVARQRERLVRAIDEAAGDGTVP
ncbi:DUF1048 domain-containing protein [Amycolatopsis sp. cg5]|uniref:DUF1048 domain-containing protein n=1 Tax=Amycolatopsis sp. cg5 TaxID=3238802 RepID=UPI00352559E6